MHAAGVDFLTRAQHANGSFLGQAGTSLHNFQPNQEHPTIFFTALIAHCLRDIPGTHDLRRRAVDYLLSQRSSDGSWNYWQRDSDMARTYPYPDDLDDTACALMAIQSFNPALLDGISQAQLAKLLIMAESAPGGPYRTWLIGDDPKQAWSDVDVVVNANIGALLHGQGITLPGLTAFIDDALQHKKLNSPYYVGIVPTLYFLASWYRGSQLTKLKKLVSEELGKHSNSLSLALLICAARELSISNSNVLATSKRLRALRQNDHWPAEPLYVDPNINGKQYYAGSAALTTAFALQALTPKQATRKHTNTHKTANQTMVQALTESQDVPLILRKPYRQAVRQISKSKASQQITDMAGLAAAAYRKGVKPLVLQSCNQGSLNGWIAYTIYDDFLDDEGKPELLGAANYALRKATGHFYEALPGHQEFRSLVDTTFASIDAANTWEVTRARANPNNLKSAVLPKYGSYRQLAERSAGHMLAACGVAYALGYDNNSIELKALKRFFHHFLIARQLNDDAHDWQGDMARGHISAVVAMLLAEAATKKSNEFSIIFWQSTILAIHTDIMHHVQAARRAIQIAGMQNPEIFLDWLVPLENSARQAVQQSQQTKEFITSF